MSAATARQEETQFPVTLYTGAEERQVTALWDTGNTLTDPVTGDPVSILAPGLAEEIGLWGGTGKGLRYIPFRSVSGDGVMPVFRVEKMCIHMEEDCWIMNPLLGVGQAEISLGKTCQMILNPGVLSR